MWTANFNLTTVDNGQFKKNTELAFDMDFQFPPWGEFNTAMHEIIAEVVLIYGLPFE